MNDKEQSSSEISASSSIRVATGCYILLLLPACLLASQAGYIFDGGESPEKQRAYWIIVSFPINIWISVTLAWVFHKAQKSRATRIMLLLPLVHFVIWLILLIP